MTSNRTDAAGSHGRDLPADIAAIVTAKRGEEWTESEVNLVVTWLCKTQLWSLLREARRRLGDPEDAKDCVQDFCAGFLIQRCIPEFDPRGGSSFMTWVFYGFRKRVLRNWERRLDKRHKRESPSPESLVGELSDLPAPGSGIRSLDPASGRAIREAIEGCLRKAREEVRAAWIAIYLDGEPKAYGERALKLGMSERALGTAMFRLNQQIRQRLKRIGVDR